MDVETEEEITYELPIENQIFRFIDNSQEGIYQMNLPTKLGYCHKKTITTVVNKLVKEYGVVAVPDKVGKYTTYRLFSPNKTPHINVKDLEEVSKENYEPPRKKRRTTKDRDYIEVNIETPSSQLENNSELDSENNSLPSTPQNKTEGDLQTNPKRKKVVTLAIVQRKRIILDELEKKKILIISDIKNLISNI